jgi:hypothetical protein
VDTHRVVPILPCTDVIETLTFYRALGFEVAYEQADPYTYAAVQKSGAELHFYGGFKKSERSGHTCLVMVPEVRTLHAQFVEGLREAFGRPPTAGFPRITRLRSGQGRFGVFDPAGNSITFVAPDEGDVDYYQEQHEKQSRLAWALDTAVWLRDIKGFDDIAAARVLDAALARNEPAAPIELARALAARAELAVAIGDIERAQALKADLAKVPLSGNERECYDEELRAAEALERLLGHASSSPSISR